MRLAPLALLLPALAASASAFRLPSPEVAFDLAHGLVDDVLHHAGSAATVLTPAADITLASVPADEHYTITSALHPNHKVRIKSTEGWCDPDVRSYSG